MKSSFIFLIILSNLNLMSQLQEPSAPKIKHTFEEFGSQRIDNYYWMNKRDSKEVIDYITEENNYTKEIMKDTEELQNELFVEITGRIQEREETVPYFHNEYWYYSRYEEGKEYQITYRKHRTLDAKEEVVLDQNILAEGKSYFAVGGMQISPNNKLLVYGYDDISRRQYKLRILNLETGEYFKEEIPNTDGIAYWANDNQTLFYANKDPQTLRTYQVIKHILGTASENDKMIFEELDDTFDVYVSRSKSGKYIWIQSHSTLSSEVQFLSADNPNSELQVINKREKDHEYDVSHIGNTFYIKTNWKAKNFRLMKCDVNNYKKENWTEVIANRDDVLFEEFELFNNYLVIEERKAGLVNIRVIDNNNPKNDYYIEFEEPTYLASLSTNPSFNTYKLRYVYSSLSTPNSTYEFDMTTTQKTLLKEKEVLGEFDKNNYKVERLNLIVRDGKKVPVSIVYKKGLKKDGSNPLLLYGYGSYGITIDAGFNFDRLSLLNRGFIYVIAHIRGGEDLGRSWYEDGKLLNKKNTFYDFIDCGKELIKLKYTSSDKMFAMGGSAGGLLMGAVLNYEPTLFKGVIAAVPFVDVMTTMFDESIPLTTSEYDEWGNPNNETSYNYILSYSPYDNIDSKTYTNILITSGYHDSQVQYWEPLKWIAKLRDFRTNKNNLLLLNMQMEAGHGGASGRYQRYKETALEYSFFLKLLK